MILISNKINPNPKEFLYWADLEENQYGGIIKYFDGENWVYLDEPIFRQSAANRVTNEDVDNYRAVYDGSAPVIQGLQNQIDNLNVNIDDIGVVYTVEQVDRIVAEINTKIDNNAETAATDNYATTLYVKDVDTKVDDTATAIRAEMKVLLDAILDLGSGQYVAKREGYDLASIAEMERLKTVKNYDDTTLRTAINALPTYKDLYTTVDNSIDNAITNLVGNAPTALDTLEELAAALNDNENFATLVIATLDQKADAANVYNKEEVYTVADVDAIAAELDQAYADTVDRINSINIPTRLSQLTNDSGFIIAEQDPTVPAWAKATTKPSYTAAEVGALPVDTHLPSKTSELTNDAGFVTRDSMNTAIENSKLDSAQKAKLEFFETGYTQVFDSAPEADVLMNTACEFNVMKLSSTFTGPITVQMDEDPKAYRKYYLYVINETSATSGIYVCFHKQDSNDLYQFDITGKEAVMFEFVKLDDNRYYLIYLDTQFNNDTTTL